MTSISTYMQKNNLIVLLWSVIAGLIVYGYSIFNFTLSIDNEYLDLFEQKISIGRWGGAFLKETILPSPYAPYFTTMIFVLFLALSYYSFCQILSLSRFNSSIFCILAMSFPSLFYQADFHMQSDAVSIGIFLGVLAAGLHLKSIHSLCSKKIKILLFFLSIVAYACSISVYQSIFVTAPGVVILFYLYNTLNGNNLLNLSKFVNFIIWCVLSVVFYFLLTKLWQYVFNIAGSSYLTDQVGWGKNSLLQNINIIYFKIKALLLGRDYYGSGIFIFSTISFLLTLMFNLKENTLLKILLLFAGLFVPFSLIIILAVDLPARTFTFQSFVYAFFIVYFLKKFETTKKYQSISILVCVVTLWHGSYIYSRLMFSDYMSWKADMQTANDILLTIRNIDDNYQDGITPVYFHGALQRVNPWKPPLSDVYGYSFFSWDNGNNDRIRHFYSTNMLATIKTATFNQAESAFNELSKRPSWPIKGSVFIYHGTVIVKLSNAPGYLDNLSK
ncbi:glucosyltransferase domain-containing protein [Mixta sp. Marseille-Q2057]|nr:glucosyltransferase domain-containing protein [Mixta mediterraneensis]